MSLDGVIDAPTWTSDYEFDPKMAEAIGAVTERCRGILLGRTTYEMFDPAWSTRTVENDPGAPFFNDTPSTSSPEFSRLRLGGTRRGRAV
jgi:RibD C-terminal domain